MGRASPRLLASGQDYGELHLVAYSHKDIRNNSFWKCICSCGTETVVRASALGYTKSCGCLAAESLRTRNRRLPGHQALVNRIYTMYQSGALKRGYPFFLRVDQFKKLILSDCYYCGAAGANYQPYRAGPEGGLYYNGIDRIDNNQGYYLHNCVTCCRQCNYAKGKKSFSEFKSWIRGLIENYG